VKGEERFYSFRTRDLALVHILCGAWWSLHSNPSSLSEASNFSLLTPVMVRMRLKNYVPEGPQPLPLRAKYYLCLAALAAILRRYGSSVVLKDHPASWLDLNRCRQCTAVRALRSLLRRQHCVVTRHLRQPGLPGTALAIFILSARPLMLTFSSARLVAFDSSPRAMNLLAP